jgi:hypothetical protein
MFFRLVELKDMYDLQRKELGLTVIYYLVCDRFFQQFNEQEIKQLFRIESSDDESPELPIPPAQEEEEEEPAEDDLKKGTKTKKMFGPATQSQLTSTSYYFFSQQNLSK